MWKIIRLEVKASRPRVVFWKDGRLKERSTPHWVSSLKHPFRVLPGVVSQSQGEETKAKRGVRC